MSKFEYHSSTQVKNVPVDILPYIGPITEVYFMDSLECGLGYIATVPYNKQLKMFSNFNNDFGMDVLDFIESMLQTDELKDTIKVVIKTDKP